MYGWLYSRKDHGRGCALATIARAQVAPELRTDFCSIPLVDGSTRVTCLARRLSASIPATRRTRQRRPLQQTTSRECARTIAFKVLTQRPTVRLRLLVSFHLTNAEVSRRGAQQSRRCGSPRSTSAVGLAGQLIMPPPRRMSLMLTLAPIEYYGPYPRTSSYGSYSSSGGNGYGSHRGSLSPSEIMLGTPSDSLRKSDMYENEFEDGATLKDRLAEARKNIDPSLLWSLENVATDDFLHEADPDIERLLDKQIGFSFARMMDTVRPGLDSSNRARLTLWISQLALAAVVLVICGLFAGSAHVPRLNQLQEMLTISLTDGRSGTCKLQES